MWTPGDNAKEREAVGAEFWKPVRKGDVILGRIAKFSENKMGESLTLSPAVVWPREGDPEAVASMSVGINATLRKRVDPSMRGASVSIRFLGHQATPEGKMRLYAVYDITRREVDSQVDKLAPGLLAELQGKSPAGSAKPPAKDKSEPDPDFTEEEDDDLPF